MSFSIFLLCMAKCFLVEKEGQEIPFRCEMNAVENAVAAVGLYVFPVIIDRHMNEGCEYIRFSMTKHPSGGFPPNGCFVNDPPLAWP